MAPRVDYADNIINGYRLHSTDTSSNLPHGYEWLHRTFWIAPHEFFLMVSAQTIWGWQKSSTQQGRHFKANSRPTDSAMLVARTILRTPTGGRLNTLRCSAAGTMLCKGRIEYLLPPRALCLFSSCSFSRMISSHPVQRYVCLHHFQQVTLLGPPCI